MTFYKGAPYLLIIKTLALLFILSYVIQFSLLKKDSYLFYILRVLLVVFIFFEVFTGFVGSSEESSIRIRGDFGIQDSVLGWRLKPGIQSEKSIQIFRGDTISVGSYSSDKFSRRIPDGVLSIPDYVSSNNNPSKHAIFLGCSFTFGSGLHYTSTFPHIFETFNPDFKSYNYGYKAFAPNQISLLFSEGVNTINHSTIEQHEGFALYTYIDAHLDRVHGHNFGSPIVYSNGDSLVVTEKSFGEKLIMTYMNSSNTLNFFNIYYSHPNNELFYERFAELINYSANRYWDLFENSKFYVGIYPSMHAQNTEWIRYLDPDIILLNIKPPADFESNIDYYLIHPKADRHPNEFLNTYYVNEINKTINTE